jgi:hypothetical protein
MEVLEEMMPAKQAASVSRIKGMEIVIQTSPTIFQKHVFPISHGSQNLLKIRKLKNPASRHKLDMFFEFTHQIRVKTVVVSHFQMTHLWLYQKLATGY